MPGWKGMTLPSCALEKGVSMFWFFCFSKRGYCSFPTDNVTLQIDGVLYLRVMDPYKVQSLPLGHLSPSSAHSLLPKMCAPAFVPCPAGGLGTLAPPKAPDSTFSAGVSGRFLALALCLSLLPCSGSLLAPLSTLFCASALQASYGVEDPEYAVTQLAQTTMRSELGKLSLDRVFRVSWGGGSWSCQCLSKPQDILHGQGDVLNSKMPFA